MSALRKKLNFHVSHFESWENNIFCHELHHYLWAALEMDQVVKKASLQTNTINGVGSKDVSRDVTTIVHHWFLPSLSWSKESYDQPR